LPKKIPGPEFTGPGIPFFNPVSVDPKPRGSEQYHVIMGRSSDLQITLLTAPSHPALNLTFISIILHQPKYLSMRWLLQQDRRLKLNA
jgi:hypothetical protein